MAESPSTPPEALAVSPDHAARMLDLSRRTVDRMIHRGEIRAVRMGGRIVRIPRSEIERLIRGAS
jgi:excisionase family DNA binding protein